MTKSENAVRTRLIVAAQICRDVLGDISPDLVAVVYDSLLEEEAADSRANEESIVRSNLGLSA